MQGPHQNPIQRQRIGTHYSSGICYLRLDGALRKGIKRQQCSSRRNWTAVVQAVAVPVAPPPEADSAEYRKQLAEGYGFKQIGEPLPDNVTLKDVIETLPKKVLSFRIMLLSEPHHQCNLFLTRCICLGFLTFFSRDSL